MRKRPSLADLEIHGQPESVNVAVSESPHEKAMPKTIYLHPAVLRADRDSLSPRASKAGKAKEIQHIGFGSIRPAV